MYRQKAETNMDTLRTCVVLALLAPASCNDIFFKEPLTCYMLDGVLITYCVIATLLYLRLKFCSTPGMTAEEPRPMIPDPYQVLEPVKIKKKAAKTKKQQKSPGQKPQQTSPLSPLSA